MGFFDWNKNGKRDSFDAFMDYKLYQHSFGKNKDKKPNSRASVSKNSKEMTFESFVGISELMDKGISEIRNIIYNKKQSMDSTFDYCSVESGLRDIFDNRQMCKDLWLYSFAKQLEFVKISQDKKVEILQRLLDEFAVNNDVTAKMHYENLKTNNAYRNYISRCFDIDKPLSASFWYLLACTGGEDLSRAGDTIGFTKEYMKIMYEIEYYLNKLYPDDGFGNNITSYIRSWLNYVPNRMEDSTIPELRDMFNPIIHDMDRIWPENGDISEEEFEKEFKIHNEDDIMAENEDNFELNEDFTYADTDETEENISYTEEYYEKEAIDNTVFSPQEEDITDKNATINRKLRQFFDGRIVRKDLTKKIKEGANVPVYVLEFLLGQYCSSDDNEIVEEGVNKVKRILADNFVRPDEAQKVLSVLREKGSYTVIDKITIHLNIKEDMYQAEFSNLGIKNIYIAPEYPAKYDRLLCGGIWCIVQLEYEYIEEEKKINPIHIQRLTPIQMPHIDMEEIKQGRSAFTKDEWISVLLRSTGMEPNMFSEREKWLLITRMLPLVENNLNTCELGPRSTGKSHLYKEISPNSILVSGGQTTVANLFYNMSTRQVGLVGLWDCVAFDEVAGIKFKDNDGVQIMKDYMASGSFSRGKEEKSASASMVFVGNINQSVEDLLKTSSLFDPFPEEMANDTAFLDRMHAYIPGWEIPKYRPNFFTNEYGFITDYLSEFMRELRKENFGDALDKYFVLGNNLNQRDTIAVRKMVSAFVKLLYPDGNYNKEDVSEIIEVALEMRRRVKEQLKRIGGMEFYDVNFSYIDNETFEEKYVTVRESGGGKLIPEGLSNPGKVYTVSRGKNGMIGLFGLETQILPGTGKFERTGLGTGREAKEAADTAMNYLRANSRFISSSIKTSSNNFIVNYKDYNGIGMTKYLALPTLIALCSAALSKSTLSGLAVLGEISIGGAITKVEELAGTLQVCLDSGAKKILLPITSAADMASVPSDLISSFSLLFYSTPQEAVFKALGVE